MKVKGTLSHQKFISNSAFWKALMSFVFLRNINAFDKVSLTFTWGKYVAPCLPDILNVRFCVFNAQQILTSLLQRKRNNRDRLKNALVRKHLGGFCSTVDCANIMKVAWIQKDVTKSTTRNTVTTDWTWQIYRQNVPF